MARLKCRPRVAQLSPEPTQPAEVAHVSGNIGHPNNSTDVAPSMTDSSNDIEDQAASDLLSIDQSTQPVLVEKSLRAEAPITNNMQLLANTDLTCPQCNSMFPNMGIQVSHQLISYLGTRVLFV
jgi:hypothetical protein